MSLAERIGNALGRAIAPLFASTSRGRHARTFHPWGDLARVTITPLTSGAPALDDLGARLAGQGFVRFSNALWKAARWPDALGCALAFEEPAQHLLFATIRRPWTMPFSPFTTHVGNYLANDYFAVSPFRAPGLERIWLRLHPRHTPEPSRREWSARRSLLDDAVKSSRADLELGDASTPWGTFVPFALVTPVALLPQDPPALQFDPFLSGRGLEPVGFVHALRHGAYAGSRAGRAPFTRLPSAARPDSSAHRPA